MGLVLVPTPLGNLRDITLRALDVLGEASLIVAEDTRVAQRLLSAVEIVHKEIVRCDEHATPETIAGIVERARTEMVAVTTDAGTPGISDPGVKLVRAAREAGVPIEALPGPTALIMGAVLSGFEIRQFSFEGFVPRAKRARDEALTRALKNERTSVWYESPFRAVATLETIAGIAPDTTIFLCRELTKMYEQQAIGTATEILEQLEQPVRGEIVIVIPPAIPDPEPVRTIIEEGTLERAIDAGLALGHSPAQLAKELAARGFGERRKLYQRVAERKNEAATPSG